MESQYIRERRALKLGTASPKKDEAPTEKPAAVAKPKKKFQRETKKTRKVNRAKKEDLATFYDAQGKLAPLECENCGHPLKATINFHPRAHICHIVPKGKDGCPSVATNTHNKWYGCLDCHNYYDKKPADQVAEMSIIPMLRERLKLFYNDIKKSEQRRVPSFLLQTT
jgi:mRNA-degrading endonuclease YafQ of YafQ-DinJ toxin-antitoxin module